MQTILTRLQQLVTTAPDRMSLFSSEQLTARPAPGKWSKKEILGHLCDSALHNWQRFTYAQRVEGVFHFDPYPQDDLVRLNGYQEQPLVQLTSLWASLNRQIIEVIEAMPEEKLSTQIALLPNGELTTLDWLIEDYLRHLEHHLGQIFPDRASVEATVLPKDWLISVETATKALATEPHGKPFISLLERGNMYVEIYAPKGKDLQTPHSQDEIYVVISGSGVFDNNGERRAFQPGDVIFVPAGIEHRFEEFSEDFRTWVIFY